MEAEEARVKALVAAKKKRDQFFTLENAIKLKGDRFTVEMLKKAGFPGKVLKDAGFPKESLDIWYRSFELI